MSSLQLTRPRGPLRRGSGFTLVEVMVAGVLASAVFLVAVALYTTTLQTSARTQAQVAASQTAANALHHVEDDIRQASAILLPTDTTFGKSMTFGSSNTDWGYSQSNFTYTDGNNNTYYTGVEICFPPTQSLSVVASTGSPLAVSHTIYNVNASDNHALYIYRSDASGVPQPSTGQYLWMYGTENGQFVNQPISRLYDTAWIASTISDGVQFFTNPTGNPNEVDIRIIGGYYSPINNYQLSESGTVMLSGKTVLLRNYVPFSGKSH